MTSRRGLRPPSSVGVERHRARLGASRSCVLFGAMLLEATPVLVAAGCGETRGVILGETFPSDDASVPPLAYDAACRGCPSIVTIGGQSDTAQQGGTTGTAYTDTCPGDQAVIGFRGFLTAPSVGLVLIGGIQALCGTLVSNGSPTEPVTTVGGGVLPVRGASQDSPWTQTCPPDAVVVGFSGRSGADLDQVAFECARWTPLDGGSDPLSIGSITVTSSGAGGDGGSPFQTMCPVGQVARGTSLRAGEWIDAFGLVCGTPALPSDSGTP